MRKAISCTFLMLMFNSMNVMAEDWSSIIKKKDYEVLVDMDSYNVANGYPYIQTKTNYQQSQTYLKPLEQIKYVSNVQSLQFNCVIPMLNRQSNLFYNQQHRLLSTEKGNGQFKPIMKGTDEAAIRELVCQVYKMVGGM